METVNDLQLQFLKKADDMTLEREHAYDVKGMAFFQAKLEAIEAEICRRKAAGTWNPEIKIDHHFGKSAA